MQIATDPLVCYPTINKIIEKLIYCRIKKIIDDKEFIPPEQFGFWEEHSTTQQLTRIIELTLKNFQKENR